MDGVGKISREINENGVGNYAIGTIFTIFFILIGGVIKFSYDGIIQTTEVNKQLMKTNNNLVESQMVMADSYKKSTEVLEEMSKNMNYMKDTLNKIGERIVVQPVIDVNGRVIEYKKIRLIDGNVE